MVQALNLKAGDEIAIEVAEPRRLRVARDPSREPALEALRALGSTLPPEFRFDREAANECGG
jgi:antitoxin MazE